MSFRIWVTVRPKAKREEVKQNAEGQYSVSVRAPVREGQANQAVIEVLADYFSVSKSSVKILRGETARRKLVEIG